MYLLLAIKLCAFVMFPFSSTIGKQTLLQSIHWDTVYARGTGIRTMELASKS